MKVFNETMPSAFDRGVAAEAFYELDSDKDGILSRKDFLDALRFDL